MEHRNRGLMVYTLIWKIENFSYSWHETGEKLVSPIFVTHMLHNTSWTLELFPRGVENATYISCFLNRNESDLPRNDMLSPCSPVWEVRYEFLATTSSGTTKEAFGSRTNFRTGQTLGFPFFMNRKEIVRKNQSSDDDYFVLQCRIHLNTRDNSNYTAKLLAKTHILVERYSLTRCYENYIAYDSIFAKHMDELPTLMIIRLMKLKTEDNLEIDLLPYDFCEYIRYSTCRLVLRDLHTQASIYSFSTKVSGPFMPLAMKVSRFVLYPDNRGPLLGIRPIQLQFELAFSAGIKQQESEEISSSRI
ncbi:speckle-type POZ protein [Nephila pilipes]|uniref:Speckle-type POZ protein n=1 Tax=Nephila pilipes TaxID=299642 RepID=A0A8X6NNP8_NEPPI|nr:speckle-type POZ protein [Nephila pilipes]